MRSFFKSFSEKISTARDHRRAVHLIIERRFRKFARRLACPKTKNDLRNGDAIATSIILSSSGHRPAAKSAMDQSQLKNVPARQYKWRHSLASLERKQNEALFFLSTRLCVFVRVHVYTYICLFKCKCTIIIDYARNNLAVAHCSILIFVKLSPRKHQLAFISSYLCYSLRLLSYAHRYSSIRV